MRKKALLFKLHSGVGTLREYARLAGSVAGNQISSLMGRRRRSEPVAAGGSGGGGGGDVAGTGAGAGAGVYVRVCACVRFRVRPLPCWRWDDAPELNSRNELVHTFIRTTKTTTPVRHRAVCAGRTRRAAAEAAATRGLVGRGAAVRRAAGGGSRHAHGSNASWYSRGGTPMRPSHHNVFLFSLEIAMRSSSGARRNMILSIASTRGRAGRRARCWCSGVQDAAVSQSQRS
jgi:hypothetical protein